MKPKIKQLIGLSGCLTLSLGTAEPALGQLEEVMVTAQKREQSLQDVPISISVLTAEDLDQQYITETDVACAGGPVPELSRQDLRRHPPTSIFAGLPPTPSKGVSSRASPWWSMACLWRGRASSYAELADVERIEVLRGPAGHPVRTKYHGRGNQHYHQADQVQKWRGTIEASLTDDDEQMYRARVEWATIGHRRRVVEPVLSGQGWSSQECVSRRQRWRGH